MIAQAAMQEWVFLEDGLKFSTTDDRLLNTMRDEMVNQGKLCVAAHSRKRISDEVV